MQIQNIRELYRTHRDFPVKSSMEYLKISNIYIYKASILSMLLMDTKIMYFLLTNTFAETNNY